MNRISSAFCAAIAFSFAAGTAVPVAAAPIVAPQGQVSSTQEVQFRWDNTRRGDRNRFERRSERRFERRQDRRERRFERRQDRREARFERRGNRYFYNGHRGYRERRAGYRYHNGWWFPPGAFIAGAIIGGALGNAPAVRGYSSAHIQWCNNRYRSYRSSDNTFQPYNGPRQQCYSPYS